MAISAENTKNSLSDPTQCDQDLESKGQPELWKSSFEELFAKSIMTLNLSVLDWCAYIPH